MAARRARGFTTVELMVGVAVLGLLMLVTVPAFAGLVGRLRLTGAANELAADLQYARSESVRRRAQVTLAPLDDESGYRITSGDEVVKQVDFPAGLAMTSDDTVVFDPLRATASAAELDLQNGAGTMRAVVSLMGRVTLCAADGDLTGYAAC